MNGAHRARFGLSGAIAALLAACATGGPYKTNMTRIAPYGSWPSPISAAKVAAGTLRFEQIVLDGPDVYWVEARASEGGRHVIVRRSPDGRTSDVTPQTMNVRTRVHEYGGAAFSVHDGTIVFSNFADQRLYRIVRGSDPVPLTSEGYYFADAIVDVTRDRLIAVREDHTHENVVNEIVAVPGTVLVSGADFYSDPIVSPDGSKLAWLQWNHPEMPWDGTELWVAEFAPGGGVRRRQKIAGGREESIFQPEWSPDGVLYFASDRTGWWNLYRLRDAGVEPLHPMAAEFGKPQWSFSARTYAFISATRIAASYNEAGHWKLAIIDTQTGGLTPLDLLLQPLESVHATPEAVYFIGGSPSMAPAIVRVSLATSEATVLRDAMPYEIEDKWISRPEAITFPAGPGAEPVHGYFYPPVNPDVAPPAGERPPLIVVIHGGPTSATRAVLDTRLLYWTSRGFAVLDVNYRGSSGYGRAYRDRLKGQWGIFDVEDVVGGARYLVEAGRVDPKRLAIRGGSAGGYTTLSALVFDDTFKAGASYFGVSDVEVLARDTHKFESRYLDSLIGPYPQMRAVYRERSPLHFTDRISSALILFQGLEDTIVPPNQSEMMAAAVRRKGLPVAYVAYPGEQHGFRRAENIIHSLESELYFYGAIFGFVPADRIEPVTIDNRR